MHQMWLLAFAVGGGGDRLDLATNSSNVAGAGTSAGVTFVVGGGTTVAATVGMISIATNAAGTTQAQLITAMTTDAAVLTTRMTTAGDVLYVLYDDGTNSYLAALTEVGGTAGYTAADGDTFALLVTFTGIADCTTITQANFVDFI
jgi:hypothetical protein